MRFVLITLIFFVVASAASAQVLKPCEGFPAKYRNLENQALAKVAAH